MKNQYRVNEQIRVREVRIVSEGGAEVMPLRVGITSAPPSLTILTSRTRICSFTRY